jgi:hypothetical protein
MAVTANAGDRIVVNSDKAGVPARQGEILGVIPHSDRPEFRVRWDDGHVTEIRPRGASYRIQAKARTTKR